LIGIFASVFSTAAIRMRMKLGYDDSIDVFGCHGVAGIWGSVATGVFATTAINPNGANGLLYGGADLLGKQLVGVAATIVFVAIVTFVILKAISFFTDLSVKEDVQDTGLDKVIHGEEAYQNT
jgi:Amt family ammonium transporter